VVLELVGTAPALDVLATLEQGPLPTKSLARRIEGRSTRGVYRSLALVEAHLLVERAAGPDGRAGAANRLTETGRLLLRCCRAGVPLRGLGEMWGLGLIQQLSHGPRSLRELLQEVEDLSYHQLRYRTLRYRNAGLLADLARDGRERELQLTDAARRHTGVIAAIGRWRQRCSADGSAAGLSAAEMATVLRTVLPLALPPERRVDLYVTGPDGAARVAGPSGRETAGSAAATVESWFAVLLDGDRDQVRVDGDLGLINDCLTQLHEVLRES